MSQEKTAVFYNKVIKQGNSLCVRIPEVIVHSLDIEVGNRIKVSLTKEVIDNPLKEIIDLIKKELNIKNEFNEIIQFIDDKRLEKKINLKKKTLSKSFKEILLVGKGKDYIKNYIKFWSILQENKNKLNKIKYQLPQYVLNIFEEIIEANL